jgi:hypothetical protein
LIHRYLSLGLHKGRLSYRRIISLQKRTSSTYKHEIFYFISIFLVNFFPPGSGSGYGSTDLIESGSGSETLLIILIVQAFNTLLSSCPEVFKPCLPKMVECCVAYLSSREKDSDREKVRSGNSRRSPFTKQMTFS